MKTTVALCIALFFISTLGGSKAIAQTVAIGHVSAEIVESVSAASAAITDFELAKSTGNIAINQLSETLNLGTITINSGKDITCNVVLKPATLSDSQGNGFTIDPAIQNDQIAATAGSNGATTIQLGGTTNRTDSHDSNLYEGSYTVVFAYN